MGQNGSLIFVDANIPMYAHGAAHPLREPCRVALSKMARGEMQTCTSAEVHQEILYRYLSLDRPIQAVQVSRDFATLVPAILPIARQDVERVWQLMVMYPGLSCRDYLHIAVMLNNNITHILSADTHFDRVGELVHISPQQFAGN